ncbi:vacuolar protein sorting-associated protein 52 homolog [Tetranychus urticae]|uniref:Vacuolar protein sorting-associated protein 52 homolog n=1 Tax=Tetranychus urticae TaxID=32264 RepID=T1L5L8_TETUR|nr:vacuolar protein sorting-associated protein 52 homolog [Tetranychus urticae]
MQSSPSCTLPEDLIGDDFIKDILSSAVDLRFYSQVIENKLREAVNASVADYISESSNIAALHSDINECDSILEKLEEMLVTFQADLGNICQEILSLQEQSLSLNIRLKNKQALRSELVQYIDEIVVPEPVMLHILDTPASEKDFIDNLMILDQKIDFVGNESTRESLPCQDVKEILEKLKVKAISKIREYILKRIQFCRRAMSNYQMEQNALLKNKFFYTFLCTHAREIAREVKQEYVDTMSKVYFSYFKEYISRLSKLKFDELPDKDDLMAADDSHKSKVSFFTGKQTLKNRSTIFTLGNRGNIVTTELESPLIIPHTATKMETKFPMEALFRSHQYAVVDNGCREYLFCVDYFMLKNEAAFMLFERILGKTLKFILHLCEEEFRSSYDCIGLFLCLHIVYRYRLLSHKRAVPALDNYWESMVEILWPRFETIFQMQIQSVKNCDPEKLGNCDSRPHYITRRYAEFSAAIMAINDTFPDERVSILLGCLQTEVENFILKMAGRFNNPKEYLVFLINNYDMILNVLLERVKEESKESQNIKQHLSKRIEDYVAELLDPHFGGMLRFVKDCESYLERDDTELLKREEPKIANIVKTFNNGWRKAIDEINREVMQNFTNFKCGNNIQQAALTELIQYYHRFHKIVFLNIFKNNPSRSSLINVHQLMVEIKKYKTNF